MSTGGGSVAARVVLVEACVGAYVVVLGWVTLRVPSIFCLLAYWKDCLLWILCGTTFCLYCLVWLFFVGTFLFAEWDARRCARRGHPGDAVNGKLGMITGLVFIVGGLAGVAHTIFN